MSNEKMTTGKKVVSCPYSFGRKVFESRHGAWHLDTYIGNSRVMASAVGSPLIERIGSKIDAICKYSFSTAIAPVGKPLELKTKPLSESRFRVKRMSKWNLGTHQYAEAPFFGVKSNSFHDDLTNLKFDVIAVGDHITEALKKNK
jgi:hypothetical protein